jgi:hypothetical protein
MFIIENKQIIVKYERHMQAIEKNSPQQQNS